MERNGEYALYRGGELARLKDNVLESVKRSLEAKDMRRVEGAVKELELDLVNLRKLIARNDIEEALRVIKRATFNRNYGNAFFTVSFTSSRTIYLTKLGFWGPAKADSASSYSVAIYIKAGISPIYTMTTTAIGKGQDVFYIVLDRRIRVSRLEACDIKFQLRGAKTCFSDYYSLPIKVVDASGVVFRFSRYESSQLPELFYRFR